MNIFPTIIRRPVRVTIQQTPSENAPRKSLISEGAVHLEDNPIELVADSDTERAEKGNDGLVDGIDHHEHLLQTQEESCPFPRYSGL